MNVLGIAAALPAELASLGAGASAPGSVAHCGDGVLMLLSGVGPERARRAARMLIERGATALLSWGSAVALDAGLRPGSVLVPTEVIDTAGAAIPVDRGWHERVCDHLQRGCAVHRAPLAETPRALAEPADKRRLAQRHGAVAADMESAALGRVALELDVRFLVLRAVADHGRLDLPPWLPPTLDEWGRPRGGAFVTALLRHPADLVRLVRLARAFRAANLSLQQARRCLGIRFLLPG